MAQTVYLESSIISYLTARPSRDVVSAARQQLTDEWWSRRRSDFDVYVSELVLAEIEAGDSEAAERRRNLITDIVLLDITDEATELAQHIADNAGLPEKAAADALHIAMRRATASITFLHGMPRILPTLSFGPK